MEKNSCGLYDDQLDQDKWKQEESLKVWQSKINIKVEFLIKKLL